jgi:protein-cysteine N-palmitoyltransferase HHAT
MFTMEVMIHLFWVVAIKDTKAWKGFSPIQIYSVGYLNLKLIWLKLLIIWRFFRYLLTETRLWGLADGIETCENMTRCMSNNYSPMQFWRNWHRSYNRYSKLT